MTSGQIGYYRQPTISGDTVVFVCEDDLWSIPVGGGRATRLTANLGEVSRPFLSPDGSQLAFIGEEEGDEEVYCMPAEGGVAKRLTFLGAWTMVAGWSQDGKSIVFVSNAAQPFYRIFMPYTIDPAGGQPVLLPYGTAHSVSFGAQGGVVLGRNTLDIARWKRYRGGTAGVIWIDPTGSDRFEKLMSPGGLEGNFASPMWVGDRIYFLCDSDGVGNLYSCTPTGEDTQQHTRHREYYARNATTDGDRIVYQMGAELFLYHPASNSNEPIPVTFRSPRVQRQRKFVDAGRYLESYNLHPEGHSVAITTRGQSYAFGNWEGAVTQIGQKPGTRYRLTAWLNDGKRFVTVTSNDEGETLEVHSREVGIPVERLEGLDIGRAIALEVSPVADTVLLANHRQELLLVDLSEKTCTVLDRSEYSRIAGFCWSPDGRWAAYGCAASHNTCSIKVCEVASGATHVLTPPRFYDMAPSFDPAGKYLYFLSVREFNPVYDSIYFDLNFPRGMRPHAIALRSDVPSPFIPVPKPLKDSGKSEHGKSDNGKKSEEKKSEDIGEGSIGEGSNEGNGNGNQPTPVEIEFEGCDRRIVAFPVAEGRYRQIYGIEGKVLFSSVPVEGSLGSRSNAAPSAKATLEYYDFAEQKTEKVATEVTSFDVGRDGETLIYRSGNALRICAIAPKSDKSNDTEPGRKSGWLDLQRVRVGIEPGLEWRQMFGEIWRLQKEQFWTPDLSDVNWERVKDRYLPLLERVTSRSEFSDLIWETQGELGTSHAYEFGGDYRYSPNYSLGFLGADLSYDPATDAYRITHIVKGDCWEEDADSALNRLGVNLQEGDLILAVGDRRVSQHCAPAELLVHQAGCEVTLTVARDNSAEPRVVTVKALNEDTSARYREWVEHNHQRVAEATQGRVGYLHVPDMSPRGYAEFHRYYAPEVEKEGLIIDVRYNGGGHVSQLLLEKLARKRIGYNVSRWGKPSSYPLDAPLGAMVAVTNEHAGSDGDIFSHCFKLMNLGKLIGKRTWGGVIGISPRHSLADGTLVTQPEFALWFQDVGWRVENYGTDPDIDLDIAPQDWAQGTDPQLERAIAEVMAALEQNPPQIPDFGDRPRLTLPE